MVGDVACLLDEELPMVRTSLYSVELLVAVDRAGSISGAARELGISQPTLSTGIARLERSINRTLIRRSPTGSALTDDGTEIAAWARDLIAASDLFEKRLNRMCDPGHDRLVIAASLTIAEYLVPQWLACWREIRTGAGDDATPRMELHVQNSGKVVDEVLGGKAELGFVECPQPAARGLRFEPIAHDRLIVVVGPRHQWAGRTTPVTAAELAGMDIVVREPGSGTYEILEQALAGHDVVAPRPASQFASTAAAKVALQDGRSVGVLSRLTVLTELAEGSLCEVATAELDLRRPLHVVGRANERLSPAAADLFRVIRVPRSGRMTSTSRW
ncbi:LysR family transcriptional regulator [Amycolatopsis alkalitolerans]|uniref:LysR family transcriptional regulator n=1 Tax=Amycolatopsis alkalitolerans TaxID=2547244 RepID=A0A5C4M2E1_9PSEU|nr:LysR family transcriptional regulator [Amycolatopsis alkalitolerans]TNC25189.1 LysR family transcriptional regulator [Amycolatopsis alkalitolerans]